MVKFPGAIIQYGHNVWIIVFVIVVKWIEKHTQTIPAVRRTKYFAVIVTLILCEP